MSALAIDCNPEKDLVHFDGVFALKNTSPEFRVEYQVRKMEIAGQFTYALWVRPAQSSEWRRAGGALVADPLHGCAFANASFMTFDTDQAFSEVTQVLKQSADPSGTRIFITGTDFKKYKDMSSYLTARKNLVLSRRNYESVLFDDLNLTLMVKHKESLGPDYLRK